MLKRLAPIPRLVPAPRSLQPTSEPTIGNLVGDGVRAGLKRKSGRVLDDVGDFSRCIRPRCIERNGRSCDAAVRSTVTYSSSIERVPLHAASSQGFVHPRCCIG
jgi:hypothetical protein